ncbi:class I SAM-dependent methyltransferase [Lactiplantibacillus xiangfangensis]|uniref:Conjugal transfer nickase helicase TraI n=1 Tax=Lactiplantibacillus xiangfangensis TaxID=942150 RepID=A0A0R2M6F1_9LACO|nr:class I SAM-dependent methyltransferase [Lactiplantibacillus xiangfangensis]KRO07563.1 conjugal transfer nickase helicase TraI [Lactiplantibacillus xiangfangensis]
MQRVQITGNSQRKVKDGYPLLVEDDLKDPSMKLTDGSFIALMASSQFMGYALVAKHRRQLGWVLSRDESETPTTDYFRKLFKQALVRRSTNFDPNLPQRVFNADGDGLGGVTIDRYQDYYVFTWYAQGIYQQREMLYAAFETATDHQFKGIYAKLRFNVGEANLKSQLVTGEAAPEPLLVTEGDVTYPVHLQDELTTGLLLDMRPIRQWMAGAELQGKTVLNLFSQENGITAAAAVAGAAKTISIETNKKGAAATADQLAVNNIDPDKQEIRAIDVNSYLDYAAKHRLSYDVVVVTAPTFARVKKQKFQVANDLTALLENALPAVRRDGQMIVATTANNFSMKKFQEAISAAFDDSDRTYTVSDTFRLPADFVTRKAYLASNYLKVLVLTFDN